MNTNKEDYKSLPAVSKLQNLPEVKELISVHGNELVLYSIRASIDFFRNKIFNGEKPPVISAIILKIKEFSELISGKSLKEVVNATGIVIHTNLGRAPFGEVLLSESFEVLKRYNNLEFNLTSGNRGSRYDHASEIIKFITSSEDVLIVNNAAAAVMLILRTFAKNKEVIVSRGELIEIGGSFRVPDIMAASDCKMIEVGTTNKTKIEDFEKAINENTAILFKAHKSNYIIKGFTQEASIEELKNIGNKYNIPVFYDMGAGLLRKSKNKYFIDEPNVKDALEKGIELICFSGDKLLGGPQAGIIVGKKIYIEKLKKEPMLRALRVCKTTLAMLETTFSYYLDEKRLNEKNLIYKIFNRNIEEINKTAEKLSEYLNIRKIETEVIASKGQCGGGSLPDVEIDSFSVMIKTQFSNKFRAEYAEKMFSNLLLHKKPVLGILKKGNIYFDILTVFENETEEIADIICEVNENVIYHLKN